ncbi:MAG: MSCRAMM family adhesin SdrC [Clostridiales bacterium]|nr:MSCRAMM family adhesin SdrC [Clostridiales bacterium]
MSYDKNSIRYRIFVVILAVTVFASIVVFSCPIVLAEEAVVLETQETESLTTEQNLNQNDEGLAIEQSTIQNGEALQIDSIEEVSSSDISDSVLESVETVDLSEETSENSDTGTHSSQISLSIDMDHVYEGMELSYKDGYVPSITENTVSLVIPFVADAPVENNQLTVTLKTTADCPFEKAEYEEEVSLKTFQFDSEGISESVDAYLFQVEFTLADDYQAGQYPVTIKAIAYSASGVKSEMICRMTVTLESDSRQQTESETEPASEIETEILQKTESESESETNWESETETKVATVSEPQPELQSEPASELQAESESEPETDSETESESTATYYSSGGSYSSGSGSSAVKHQPHILLEECSLSGAQLPAGEQMDFTASFQNTSDDQTVYSLKITVNTADENVALSSTSYYYDQVAPQEVVTLENTIAASAAATQKVTTLSYAFVYETSDGTSLSDSEELFFDISQETQVSIEDFNLSDYVYSLETVTATLEIRNTGRSPVYNVRVSLEADGLIATNTVYAGNMEAGTSSDESIKIYVSNLNDKDELSQAEDSDIASAETAYGSTTGLLTLTWEDAYGTVYTETREFTTTIAAPQVVELSVEAEEESVTNQWWAVTIVIMVLFFLLLIAVLIRKLTKKRHQMEDLLAEMEHSYDKTETK